LSDRALDSGASGIILPMINNKSDVDEIIEKALFPPRGKRSFGPAMAPWGLPDGAHGGVSVYFQWALEGQIALLPMIESKEGLENAEQIISTEGVSGVFIGPMDLRLSLGLNGGDGLEPEYIQALNKICSLTKKYNKIVGSLGMDATTVRRRAEDGMNFLVVSADANILDVGFQKALGVAHESIQHRGNSSL
jgi:2-keto-3-deoxy-L-rhamnonate aldolase RhmA